ncbi:MAG: hypothetical protein U0132_24170, partial [Gemmatimonadaceae bacterium]
MWSVNKMGTGATEKDSKTEQTLDAWGNVTQVLEYNFGTGVAPETIASRQTTISYVTSTAYTSRFIQNLPSVATTPADTTTFAYDEPGSVGATMLAPRQHDAAVYNVLSYTVRGNASRITNSAGIRQTGFDTGGNVTVMTMNGQTQAITSASTYNFAAPTNITPNGQSSLAATMTYSDFLGLGSVTGPNGAAMTLNYDAQGRPLQTVSPHGAQTNYSYSTSPAWRRAVTGTHWTKDWYDGLGRVKKTEAGDIVGGADVVRSVVETQYAPCGCSPVGKVKQVSQPYAPGGSAYWTVYAYDGMGRVTSVTHPGGGSVTGYSYSGNTVTVTDPAGRWKKHEMDAFGNLVKVTEPRPGGGTPPEYTTSYTYNGRNQLLTVSMPRDGVTQTRTFSYYADGKLMSENLPETGSTSYGYDSYHRLSWKIDANYRKTEYTYENQDRVSAIRKYVWTVGGWVEKVCEAVQYYYDGYAYPYTDNAAGRLAAAVYGSTDTGNCAGPGLVFEEMYGYTQGGLVKGKTVRATKNVQGYGNRSTILASAYTYNSEGQMLTEKYPDYYTSGNFLNGGPQYAYEYNGLAQLTGIKETPSNFYHLSGMQYGAAGQLTNLAYAGGVTQVREYNTRLQLTKQT